MAKHVKAEHDIEKMEIKSDTDDEFLAYFYQKPPLNASRMVVKSALFWSATITGLLALMFLRTDGVAIILSSGFAVSFIATLLGGLLWRRRLMIKITPDKLICQKYDIHLSKSYKKKDRITVKTESYDLEDVGKFWMPEASHHANGYPATRPILFQYGREEYSLGFFRQFDEADMMRKLRSERRSKFLNAATVQPASSMTEQRSNGF